MKLAHRPLPAPPPIEVKPGQRYIKTRVRVFQYPDLRAADLALPRLRRTDATARIIPEEDEYRILSTTPSHRVVYYDPRKA